MKVQVIVEGRETPIELELDEVQSHMAHTTCGRAYCLDDGALFCHAEGGERLTPESLAVCHAMERKRASSGAEPSHHGEDVRVIKSLNAAATAFRGLK